MLLLFLFVIQMGTLRAADPNFRVCLAYFGFIHIIKKKIFQFVKIDFLAVKRFFYLKLYFNQLLKFFFILIVDTKIIKIYPSI